MDGTTRVKTARDSEPARPRSAILVPRSVGGRIGACEGCGMSCCDFFVCRLYKRPTPLIIESLINTIDGGGNEENDKETYVNKVCATGLIRHPIIASFYFVSENYFNEPDNSLRRHPVQAANQYICETGPALAEPHRNQFCYSDWKFIELPTLVCRPSLSGCKGDNHGGKNETGTSFSHVLCLGGL
ncbi:hypothetical protein BD779DRAFT_802050 [Infundibulicybe gibba]|nr:hypothetical protein BD779DRAFT_802050 [Infundibulicybe gibba]